MSDSFKEAQDRASPPEPAQVEGPLSPELERWLQRDMAATTALYRVYHHVQQQARRGEPITGGHFTVAEAIHDLVQEGLPDSDAWGGIQQGVHRQIREDADRMAGSDDASREKWSYELSENDWIAQAQMVGWDLRDWWARTKSDFMEDRLWEGYQQEYHTRIEAWEAANPDVARSLNNPIALNNAFTRQYIEPAPHRKNVTPAEGTHTEPELVADLLSKNPGIVIGDAHSFDDSLAFLNRNMPVFAMMNVRTIYMESEPYKFNLYTALSTDALRELSATRSYTDKNGFTIRLSSEDEVAAAYNVRDADDTGKAFVDVLIAAREHGIRVVNIDKTSYARDVEGISTFNHRVASTNFTWMDAIKADHEAQGNPDARYVVFGGQGHFINAYAGPGLVDDALGLPVLAFDRREDGPEFQRGHSPNGPDFYLSGGTNYNPTRLYVAAEDINQAGQTMRLPFPLPTAMLSEGMVVTSKMLRAYADNMVYLPSQEEPSAPGNLTPPSTPNQPMSSAPGRNPAR